MDPTDLSLLNEMLDRIQNLGISDGQSSVYDQIGLKADDREIYVPPTTHLVATVEDLTDVLNYASEEATDMDEDVDGASGVASPMAISHTGNWAATSTYDVYMVDTPKEDGEEEKDPPKRRRTRKRSKGTGRGKGSQNNNTDATDNGATPDDAEYQGNGDNTTPGQLGGPTGMSDNEDPEDPEDPEDKNYLPESEEEVSLGPEEFIVPEDPYEQEKFRRRLVATARSMKKQRKQLQADQDTLNDKWVEVLAAEQDLELRRADPVKSYPRRRLLPAFDDEVAENVPFKHDGADQPDRPPRGRDRPTGGNKNPPTIP